jgi:hypothetical protein
MGALASDVGPWGIVAVLFIRTGPVRRGPVKLKYGE